MLKKTFQNQQALIGLSMISFMLIAAAFAPVIAPNNPDTINIVHIFASGDSQFPLGTDEMGRCVLSRLLYGARNSLSIAFPAIFIAALLSTIISISCAYAGGLIDKCFLVLCDIFMAFPAILIAITLVGTFGKGYGNIITSVVLSMWVFFAKVTRTFVLQEKNKDYITACRISGCSDSKILFFHILPNILPHLIVYFSTGIASIVITVSTFAFLGLGFETGTAEWGAMFSKGAPYLFSHPTLLIYPGVCIVFTAAGFNLFGEALRDIISPEGS